MKKEKRAVSDNPEITADDDLFAKTASETDEVCGADDKAEESRDIRKNVETSEGGKSADKKGRGKEIFFAVLRRLKKTLYNIFITGLTGMAQGLFATLIVGTILCQIALIFPDGSFFFTFFNNVGWTAKAVTGAGIGVAVAKKFKASTLTTVSAAVCGMAGAFAGSINSGTAFDFAQSLTLLKGPGEPLGAFIGAYFCVFVGSLVSGKTKVDILVTPLCCIIGGSALGLLIGGPVSAFMSAFGQLINLGTQSQPIIMGMVVSALMGIALTLPISSAAIGLSLGLSGIAAGAATVGCCCQMVGFAVMSFRENKWGGLISQGIGTSMLQMPNIIRRPIVWIPPILASVILGPVSTAAFGMVSNSVGSGMGTAGLVGPIMAFSSMVESGFNVWVTLGEIALMYFILPAVICWGAGLLFRKLNWIREGDLKI